MKIKNELKMDKIFTVLICSLTLFIFSYSVSADDCATLCPKCNLGQDMCENPPYSHRGCEGNDLYECTCEWVAGACQLENKTIIENCAHGCEQLGVCSMGGGEAWCKSPNKTGKAVPISPLTILAVMGIITAIAVTRIRK